MKTRDHGLRRQHAHACGGKLDGEGQRVETPTQLGYGLAVVVVDGEVWPHLARSLLEEPHGRGDIPTISVRQRRNGNLSLAVDAQRFAARGQDLQMRRRREQRRDVGRGLEHLLEIVEHEQCMAGSQEAEQHCPWISAGRWQGDLEGGDDGGRNVARVAHAGEGHVGGAVAERRAEGVGQMDSKARLASPPGPGERHQAGVRTSQQLSGKLHLGVAADELPALDRREAARRSSEGGLGG